MATVAVDRTDRERVAPPPTLSRPGPAGSPPPFLRFSDVLAELDVLVSLAETPGDGSELAAAARRTKSLLSALRIQFLQDVVLGLGSPAPEPS